MVTFNKLDVAISPNNHAFEITGTGNNCRVTLIGDNLLYAADRYAGIAVAAGMTLTITSANGGSVSPGSKKLIEKESYGTLPTPTRSGYTFLGWFTAASGGKEVSASTKMPASNVTIYARWKEGVDPNAELVGYWSCMTLRMVIVGVFPYMRLELQYRMDSYKFNSNGTFEYYPYDGSSIYKGTYYVSNGKLNLRNIKSYYFEDPNGNVLASYPDKVMEYQIGKDKDGEYLMVRSLYEHLNDTSVNIKDADKYKKSK